MESINDRCDASPVPERRPPSTFSDCERVQARAVALLVTPLSHAFGCGRIRSGHEELRRAATRRHLFLSLQPRNCQQINKGTPKCKPWPCWDGLTYRTHMTPLHAHGQHKQCQSCQLRVVENHHEPSMFWCIIQYVVVYSYR